MKLRRGEHVTCSFGHVVGKMLADVQDHEPVLIDALAMSRGRIPAGGQRWVYLDCNEVVAIRGERKLWSMRTLRGWIA